MSKPSPGARDDSGASYQREPGRGVPGWLKVAGIVALMLALLVVILVLMFPGDDDGDGGGGGPHGPRRHGSASGPLPAAAALVLER